MASIPLVQLPLVATAKRCAKCGTTKPLTEFYVQRTMRDGHHSWCRSCVMAAYFARAKRCRQELEPRPCAQCGSTIACPFKSQRFCSSACAKAARSGPPRPCAHCAQVFQPFYPGALYCTRACWRAAKKTLRPVTRPCLHCGVVFSREPRKGKMPQYCSRRCAARAHYRSPGLNVRRDRRYYRWHNAVMTRDKVCQDCGATERLHAHHLLGWATYPEARYDVANGVVLCADCHLLRHPDIPLVYWMAHGRPPVAGAGHTCR